MAAKRNISNYLIKSRLQISMAVKYLVICLICCVLTGLMVYMSVWPVLSKYVTSSLLPWLQNKIIFRMFLMGIPVSIFILLTGIIISHRIAGPIYKIEKHLDQIMQGGPVEAIVLRKGDFGKSLASKLNSVLFMLEKMK